MTDSVLKSVYDLGLSNDLIVLLDYREIVWISDLTFTTENELLEIPDMDKKSLSKIKNKLKCHGLSLINEEEKENILRKNHEEYCADRRLKEIKQAFDISFEIEKAQHEMREKELLEEMPTLDDFIADVEASIALGLVNPNTGEEISC